jgi:hypothetical protein
MLGPSIVFRHKVTACNHSSKFLASRKSHLGIVGAGRCTCNLQDPSVHQQHTPTECRRKNMSECPTPYHLGLQHLRPMARRHKCNSHYPRTDPADMGHFRVPCKRTCRRYRPRQCQLDILQRVPCICTCNLLLTSRSLTGKSTACIYTCTPLGPRSHEIRRPTGHKHSLQLQDRNASS